MNTEATFSANFILVCLQALTRQTPTYNVFINMEICYNYSTIRKKKELRLSRKIQGATFSSILFNLTVSSR